uniref:Cyclic nucleotide-binding domain-containing protein n=1 Tax=Romanomermis culicivorax TaxID=13658 RepID=A0A915KKY0_ROMCU
KGDVFGDEFWKESGVGQSATNVRALTYSDLHKIKSSDLLEILNFYEAFANSFSRNLVLTYNIRKKMKFRKIVDVKREKELEAETRNQMRTIAHNHPVRKLLSKISRKYLLSSKLRWRQSSKTPSNINSKDCSLYPNYRQHLDGSSVHRKKSQSNMSLMETLSNQSSFYIPNHYMLVSVQEYQNLMEFIAEFRLEMLTKIRAASNRIDEIEKIVAAMIQWYQNNAQSKNGI